MRNMYSFSVLVVALTWVRLAVVKPIGEWISGSLLGAFEESTKSIVFGWFEVGNRALHAFSSVLLSVVSRNSNSKRKEVNRRTRAWERWWNEYGPAKGTFNLTFDLLDTGSRKEEMQVVAGAEEWRKDDKRVTKRSRGSRKKRKGHELKRKGSLFDSYTEAGYAMFGKISDFQDSVRRRGLLEDFRFSVEVGISNTFAWFSRLIRKIFFLDTDHQSKSKRARRRAKKMLRAWERLHTYTAADAILRAGYPLEEHSVTTEDGYVLQMHRIPRRTSMDVVFFQHGVMDTSLSWVVNGVGGSVAFTAYDDGFDVWLGNTRSNPPRINVKPGVRGAKYWRWSANELAVMDLKAQFDYIHRIKMQELRKASFLDLQTMDRHDLRNRVRSLPHSKTMPNFEASSLQPNRADSIDDDIAEEHLPYRLQAVGHSLGAACLLMYAVHCKLNKKDHRLKRLVLLSPAGFHPRIPWAIRPCKWIFPVVTKMYDKVRPQGGIGLRLPSWPLRWITFKLMADVNRSPVLFDLFSAAFRGLTSGDSSEWTKAMSLPHYNANSMPAVSLHTANQFAQWANNPIFGMYDYGSMEKNLEVYGSPVPHSIAQHYDLINTLPIDLASGSSDGLIPPESVEMHLFWMKKGNVPVTVREFDYGHLEFIFGVGHELVTFIISCLKQSSSLQTI